MYKFFTSTQLAKRSNPQPTASFFSLVPSRRFQSCHATTLISLYGLCSTWGNWDNINPLDFAFTSSHDWSSEGDSQRRREHTHKFSLWHPLMTWGSWPQFLQVCNITQCQCKLLPLDSLLFIKNLIACLSNSCSRIYIHWEWLYLVAIASCIWLPLDTCSSRAIYWPNEIVVVCCKTSKRQILKEKTQNRHTPEHHVWVVGR